MHIPDNYLSPSTCAVMGAAMAPVWAMAVKRVKKEIPKKKMPLMGIGASFSFLIMMFNIPLPGGTSGHAVGGMLLAILLGPESACISITVALLIQSVLFGDGGILAFGANCFNMAFVIPFAGYYIYKLLSSVLKSEKGQYAAAFIGSYAGLGLGAFFASIELGLQPLLFKDAAGMPLYCPYPLWITIPSMLIPNLLVIGFLEGIVTFGVLRFVKKVSPETVYDGSGARIKPVYAMIIGLICLSPLGLIASAPAWGEWERNAISSVTVGGKSLGYVPQGMLKRLNFSALMSGYSIKGLPEVFGYIISAAAGALILLTIFRIISSTGKDSKD